MSQNLNKEHFARKMAQEILTKHPEAIDLLTHDHGEHYSPQEKVLFFYAQIALPEEEERLFNRIYTGIDSEVFHAHSFKSVIGELAPYIIAALQKMTGQAQTAVQEVDRRSTAELRALESAAD